MINESRVRKVFNWDRIFNSSYGGFLYGGYKRMNEAWIIEWWETCQECENLYQTYCNIVAPGFFTKDSTPDRAALWLARDTFLEAMLDLVRDLYWHNLGNRPISKMG